MRFLLDANVLIALTDTDHVSHDRATAWFQHSGSLFATCPITQGALIRFWMRVKADATVREAKEFLRDVVSMRGHEFWPDSVSFLDLIALAHKFRGRVATLDRALAAIHKPDAILIP
jgi:predicted nucleic acid-binding protein